jgi:F-type H+-transporting ATPase subunit gamma
MESKQKIKQRIKSVKNIGQITKAMELVSATKMRRAEEVALSSRPYSFLALDLLGSLSKLEGVVLPEILTKREIKKTAVVVVTSDKGLAGAFNNNVLRKFDNFIKKEGVENKIFIAVGKKAGDYLLKFNPYKIFLKYGDYTKIEQIKPLAELLINGFLNKEWDRVLFISMHFRSALVQEPLIQEILPVDFNSILKTLEEIVPETGKFSEYKKEKQLLAFKNLKALDYLIEPSPEILLDKLGKHLILIQIYHLILEANASEHSARRLAMKNAGDNAEKLSFELTLFYNKARQDSITKELTEITSGAEALNT